MGKFVKKLTDVTCQYEVGTLRIISISMKVKDIKTLVDKNGYLVVENGEMVGDADSRVREFLYPSNNKATSSFLARAKKAIPYNRA
jgi:hypothetical protein